MDLCDASLGGMKVTGGSNTDVVPPQYRVPYLLHDKTKQTWVSRESAMEVSGTYALAVWNQVNSTPMWVSCISSHYVIYNCCGVLLATLGWACLLSGLPKHMARHACASGPDIRSTTSSAYAYCSCRSAMRLTCGDSGASIHSRTRLLRFRPPRLASYSYEYSLLSQCVGWLRLPTASSQTYAAVRRGALHCGIMIHDNLATLMSTPSRPSVATEMMSVILMTSETTGPCPGPFPAPPSCGANGGVTARSSGQ